MRTDRLGNFELIKLLLSAGASLRVQDFTGKIALDYAREYEHSAMDLFLKERGLQARL